jgi:hypothetical protein
MARREIFENLIGFEKFSKYWLSLQGQKLLLLMSPSR